MLKDRVINVADLVALNPDEDPLLYVAPDWTGTVESVLGHGEVPIFVRMWVVLQFFEERYYRQYILNCIKKAAIAKSVDANSFLINVFALYDAYLTGTGTLAAIYDLVYNRIDDAFNQYMVTRNNYDKFFARCLCALKWASRRDTPIDDPSEPYQEHMVLALHDILLMITIDECKTELLAVLDSHP